MARNEHPGRKAVADSRSAIEQRTAEQYERHEASQPTPTQEENDLARLGALDHDEKEPDGSEPEEVAVQRMMAARFPGNQGYGNRAMSTSGDDQSNEAQRRGAESARKGGGARGGAKASAKRGSGGRASKAPADPGGGPLTASSFDDTDKAE